MITTHLHWSSDISTAPKGEMVTTTYQTMVKGEAKERSRTEHVPTRILAVSECGKVMVTYWLPEKLSQGGLVMRHGHWSGFPERSEFGAGPVLWAAMPDAAGLLETHSAISCAISITEEDAE